MNAWFLLLALAAGTPGHVRGSGILRESFPYPDGPLVGSAGSPWANNSGTAGTALVVSNRLELSSSGSRGEDVAAPLGRTYSTNGSDAALYASFSVVFTNLPSQNGSYFTHFTGPGNPPNLSVHRCRVWASISNATTGKFRLGIANGSGGHATSGQADRDLNLHTSYRLITRYELASGSSTLWIGPASESDPSVTAADPAAHADIAYYSFRQSSGIGFSLVDNLKVGTSFHEVAVANSPPTLSTVADQRTPANTPIGPIAFLVGDIESPAAALAVAASSTDQVLLPDANILIAGTGAERTLQLTPAAGQQGVAIVTVVVSDPEGERQTNSFRLIVGAPSLSRLPSWSTPTNTVAGPVPFVIEDSETPAEALRVTAISSNQMLVANAAIQITGTGRQRALFIGPTADLAGLTAITVTVSDGQQSVQETFVLTVHPLLGRLREDDFNRPDGPLLDFSGDWLSNGGMGGTNLGQMQIAQGQLQITETQSEDVNTELPPFQPMPPVYSTNSGMLFYVGLRFRIAELPSPGGTYFAHFRDAGFGYRAKMFVGTANAAPGRCRVGIANSASSLGAGGQIPVDLATNSMNLLVLRYNVGTAESRLWLNPTTEASPSTPATDSAQPVDICYFSFRQDGYLGTVLVDHLMIGTAFTDVAPAALTVSLAAPMLRVSWQRAYTDYLLQWASSLQPVAWETFPGSPGLQGDQYYVDCNLEGGTRFFRLARRVP